MAMRAAFLLVLALAPACVHADTIYRSVGPDGRITYSQKPPAGAKVEKTLTFTNLPATPIPESLMGEQKKPGEPGKRMATGRPVLFTAVWCGYCTQAKAYLAKKGVSYTEYDIDTPGGAQAFRESAGGKGIPVLLLNERRVQGYSQQAYDALFAGR
jgi:glutaredoxin